MPLFGDKLRELRGETPRKELAEKSGITVSYLANLENNRYPNPSVGTVYKLARALGVGCEAFDGCDFTGETSPTPKAGPGRPKKAEPELVKPAAKMGKK